MNSLMPNTTTSTELQRNYKKVADRSKKIKEPIVVLSNNKPEGVYIDYETFVRNYVGKVKHEKIKLQRGLLRPFGTWTKEEADEFDKVIEEAFEQINPEGWK